MRTASCPIRSLPPRAVPAAPVGEDIALAIRGLVKIYGNLIAVADLSSRHSPDPSTGSSGPNGAGKTTTLTMATGLLHLDRGTGFHGVDVGANPGGTCPARCQTACASLTDFSGPDFLSTWNAPLA